MATWLQRMARQVSATRRRRQATPRTVACQRGGGGVDTEEGAIAPQLSRGGQCPNQAEERGACQGGGAPAPRRTGASHDDQRWDGVGRPSTWRGGTGRVHGG